MDNPVPRSKTVAVTVASEQEPVVVDGTLLQQSNGFALEFSIGNDKFTVTHADSGTRVVAVGVMAYDILLCNEKTQTVLQTPYGMVKFDVTTVKRDVTESANGLRLRLAYILSAATADLGEMAREVDITVEYSTEVNNED